MSKYNIEKAVDILHNVPIEVQKEIRKICKSFPIDLAKIYQILDLDETIGISDQDFEIWLKVCGFIRPNSDAISELKINSWEDSEAESYLDGHPNTIGRDEQIRDSLGIRLNYILDMLEKTNSLYKRVCEKIENV